MPKGPLVLHLKLEPKKLLAFYQYPLILTFPKEIAPPLIEPPPSIGRPGGEVHPATALEVPLCNAPLFTFFLTFNGER